MTTVVIGSDHRGTAVAQAIESQLRIEGFKVHVLGDTSGVATDYPDAAWTVAQEIVANRADRGILICGTGIGMAIAANKVAGIRAALALDELSAQLSRSHNDANVLCLSADLLGQTLVKRIVDVWMRTKYDGGRHARRLAKIARIELGEDPKG
ncbi:MAG: ribose 5-phosphate isomerase B [Phycisphaerales bacterium]|nr:ribose 5-phosphate isomerase B [Phycisphaerales bacterium]